MLGRAGERGQQRRLAAAKDGIVTWQNPADVAKFIEKDSRERANQFKAEVAAAKADGTLHATPVQREDLMTDDELLAEMLGTPISADRDDLAQ